ncbi:hypothetical protein [Embleya sp. NPDC020886]|uniref:hypothetical protein n=1 Tax=Embleya sp. NPDC020886 TaxID=3363980 RepID=UPI0037B34B96
MFIGFVRDARRVPDERGRHLGGLSGSVRITGYGEATCGRVSYRATITGGIRQRHGPNAATPRPVLPARGRGER